MKKMRTRFSGPGKLRDHARRLRKRLFRGALILLYHRVCEQLPDPQRLCVTPKHFLEHLDVLHRFYSPISLSQMVQSVRDRKIVGGSVVLTFDDGYRDNLLEAGPLMERYAIPATVFVTTGYANLQKDAWWDRLHSLFLHPGNLPGFLHVTIEGKKYRWELGDAASYGETSSRVFALWNVEARIDPTPRHQIYRDLFLILRSMDDEEKQAMLTDLFAWAGIKQEGASARNMLSHEELAHIAKEGLFEVGSHSVTHPILSRLSPDRQRAEIQGSKKCLEGIIGGHVTSFAYPYGSLQDYTPETITIVRESGFACACSNFPGLVFRGADTFQLPRFLLRDWDGEEFSRRLDGWFRD